MSLLEKEWFIEAPWGRICIVAWGNCLDPPVLLCHGSLDSAASFRPLIKMLPEKFYYIGIELPGNGKSDRFPPGMPIHVFDMVYAVHVVVKHFRWDSFIYMGHSLGGYLGQYYDLSYSGKISKVIYLDPITSPNTWDPASAKEFRNWYHRHFTEYFDKYDIYNSIKEDTPRYKLEEAVEKVRTNMSLTYETALATVERYSEPAGDGYIRFTFDQRTKLVTRPPISVTRIKILYTELLKTPNLTIIADLSKRKGLYSTKFMFDENAYPHRNYRVREVIGHHNVHITNPEKVAPFVAQFLLYGLDGIDGKAKL